MVQTPKNDPALQVASISARQAIVVALITSLAGLLGVYIGNQQKKTDSVDRHIKFTGVESPEAGAVRVVFEVNGQPYSYPSRVLWADISPHMSPESFPLASGQSTFSVHVFAYFRDSANGKLRRFETQDAKVLSALALPAQSETTLSEIDSESFNRGRASLKIEFEVY